MASRQIIISGKVQGVGFRPFIFRLAHQYQLRGQVKNSSGRVDILVQGDDDQLAAFEAAIVKQAPPLAEPRIESSQPVQAALLDDFCIVGSDQAQATDIHIPADYFTCDDCLAELMNPADRRYRYPFINCTNCGPRYTLIAALPYDRPNTSMAEFPLCPDCAKEYADPYDRRFHAQPLACEVCGPQLEFNDGRQRISGNPAALEACVDALRRGRIVAARGIGGYHLMCDARNSDAVALLRERKRRPDKPFAILFPWQGENGAQQLARYLDADDAQLAQLIHPSRSIVLTPCKPDTDLAANLNPGLHEVGAMLPYSPLHHLLSHDFGGPLVATSANISGEPVITSPQDAEQRLGHIVDVWLHHNRPILRPADDSVLRIIRGRPHYLRLGRGAAPLELTLPFQLPQPMLAVGGHMKNTVALAWHNRVVISPHIGDLSSLRSMQVFEQVVADLQQLYQVRAETLVCDAHPDYASHQWADRYATEHDLPLRRVFHHHAHAGGICGEFDQPGPWLVFTWDGTGYGADASIWGGETLFGGPGAWQRVGRLRPFRLLGGDRASTQPWRSAAALCWAEQLDWQVDVPDLKLARQAWDRDQGCFTSSAAGRLFDAAAAMIMDIQQCSFDGQAPMLLEQQAQTLSLPASGLPLQTVDDALLEVDWAPLLPTLLDDSLSREQRSSYFHSMMGRAILDQALAMRVTHGHFTVGLSGGVFQNRRLTEFVIEQLQAHDFTVYFGRQIPCNDAGISYGQIIEAFHQS